ncbi:MAG: FKBP-type peptidyl-prolyl cis-trans isomerase [Thioalkalivibrionaceae bacterium]
MKSSPHRIFMPRRPGRESLWIRPLSSVGYSQPSWRYRRNLTSNVLFNTRRARVRGAVSAPFLWGVILACTLSLGGLFLVADWWFSQASDPMERVMLGEINTEEGAALRASNRARSGVVEYPSGLQVEVLTLGDGERPRKDDEVVLHYRAWHADGRLIEDTERLGTPATVLLERTIPGWREVLPDLPVGSRVRLVVPPELAYGAAGSGRVGPRETLIFEVHLLETRTLVEPEPRSADQHRVPGLGF